jgi:hypothetical protein
MTPSAFVKECSRRGIALSLRPPSAPANSPASTTGGAGEVAAECVGDDQGT